MLLPARTLCSSPALRAASLRVRLLQTRPAVASPRSSPPSPHLAPPRLLSLSARPRCVPSRSQTVARLLSTTPTPTPPPPAPAPKPPLPADDPPSPPAASSVKTPEARENPYTLPNAITVARMAACPVIGYYILEGDLATATGLLFVAGVSDLVRSPLYKLQLMRQRADDDRERRAGRRLARTKVQHGLGPRQYPRPGGRQASHDHHGRHARHARHAPPCVRASPAV